MRIFLTLCSLVAFALAKPQYNYGNGVSGTFGSSHGGGGGGGGSTGGLSQYGSGNYASSGSNYQSGGGGSLTSSFGGSSLGGSSYNSGSPSGSYGGGGSQSFGGFESPLVHKQFITIAAPDDHDNLERTKHLVIGRPQKNYRVVFIKAPSSSSANVRLSAEYAPKEEKTVIYVLSKKDSQLEVNDIATPAPTVPSKPEVFFIKYKTEAEAQHAQRQIQAEYDKIEGTSEHTDAGVAPQQSVVGILGNGNAGGAASSAGGSYQSGGSSGSFSSGGGSSSGFIGGSGSSGFGGSSGSIGGGVKNQAYLPPNTA